MPEVMEAPGDILADAIGEVVPDEVEEAEVDAGAESDGSSEEAEVPEAEAGDADSESEEGEEEIDPDSSYRLADDGKALIVPKQDYQMLKGLREYAEPLQDKFPTVTDALIAYEESLDLRSMRADWTNDTDHDIEKVLNYLAGGAENDETLRDQFRQSFTHMTKALPGYLRKLDTDAYGSLMDSAIEAKKKELYDKAARSQNPTDVESAQYFDYALTRRYEKELQKPDPEVEAREALEAKRNEVAQREAAILDRDWKAFDVSVLNGVKFREYWKPIDAMLEPLKAQYSQNRIDGMRRDINAGIVAAIGRDPEWVRNHNNEYANIKKAYEAKWRKGESADSLKQRVAAFQNDYLTKARRYLPSVAKQIIDQEGSPAKTAQTKAAPPQQGTQKPATAAAKGKGGGGRPAAHPIWGNAFNVKA